MFWKNNKYLYIYIYGMELDPHFLFFIFKRVGSIYCWVGTDSRQVNFNLILFRTPTYCFIRNRSDRNKVLTDWNILKKKGISHLAIHLHNRSGRILLFYDINSKLLVYSGQMRARAHKMVVYQNPKINREREREVESHELEVAHLINEIRAEFISSKF